MRVKQSEGELGVQILNCAFMPQKAVAELLGLSERTLERFRLEGRGPAYHKFGKRVLYSRSSVLAWANARLRMSTSDSDAPEAA